MPLLSGRGETVWPRVRSWWAFVIGKIGQEDFTRLTGLVTALDPGR